MGIQASGFAAQSTAKYAVAIRLPGNPRRIHQVGLPRPRPAAHALDVALVSRDTVKRPHLLRAERRLRRMRHRLRLVTDAVLAAMATAFGRLDDFLLTLEEFSCRKPLVAVSMHVKANHVGILTDLARCRLKHAHDLVQNLFGEKPAGLPLDGRLLDEFSIVDPENWTIG